VSKREVLGWGLHVSRSGNLVLVLEGEARLGEEVVDERGRVVGRVSDIFGPVEKPFAAVKLLEGVELGKVGDRPFYASGVEGKKRRKARRRRRG